MRRTSRSWALGGALLLVFGAGSAGPHAVRASAQQMAYEDVVTNLRNGDPRVRLESLVLLRGAGYLESATPVAALIGDPVADVQAAAVETELLLYLADDAYTREFGREIVKAKDASLALLAFAQGPGALIPNVPPPAVVTKS